MTRKNKRAIENALDELEDDHFQNVTVFSSIVVVGDDSIISEPEPPEGYTLGDEIPTQSPVVVCHELEPIL